MENQDHILIIDEVHPILLELLKDFKVVYVPDISLEELPDALAKATILILRSKLTLDKSWISQAPHLRLIGRLGSGLDNIDTDFAASVGIHCVNAPEGNRNAVAEQTIGMMLSLISNINKSSLEVKKGVWDRKGNQGEELGNMCVGIIGYGNVGSALSEKLRSFGCNVIAYDKFRSDFGSEIVEEVTLQEIQKRSDVISIHTPLNQYSEEMIDADFIANVSKPFYLLNLARGKICVLMDVIDGLSSEKLKGVALDVLPNEKLKTMNNMEKMTLEKLLNNNRVIITPHIGGLTRNSYVELARVLGNKIKMWVQNHPLVNPN